MIKLLKGILFLLCFTLPLNAQQVKQNLLLPDVINYNQIIFVYGYQQINTNLFFKCYSYNYDLQIKDSLKFDLGKHLTSDYLDISVDTLHDVLNFYFQLANQKNEVSLLRLNDSLKIIAQTQNYDANRINSLTAFDDEKYTFKKDVYTIRTNTDTSGKQFYLNKYTVKDMQKPFEYDDAWQYPFERKYIHRASVMYANQKTVIVYANVSDGPKKGQWILRINAQTGEIVKGTKLSAKNDTRHFLMSNLIYDEKLKSIDVIGSIYAENAINFKNKTYDFTNQSKSHKLFLITIDSIGEVVTRAEKLFPMPIQTKSVEGLKSFHVKVREFKKLKDYNFDVWLDVYEQSKAMVFCYYSSWHVAITPDDVDYTFNTSKFFIATSAIPNYISFTKGDTYGKFILTDISEYDKFKYQSHVNNFVLLTSTNEADNSNYILKKTDLLNATKTYNYVYMGKKNLENKILLKSEKGQKASLFFTKNGYYVTFITNINNTDFELKLNSL